MKFRVWQDGMPRDTGIDVDAPTPGDAVEAWARRLYVDAGTKPRVCVERTDGGSRYLYAVEVERTTTYHVCMLHGGGKP